MYTIGLFTSDQVCIETDTPDTRYIPHSLQESCPEMLHYGCMSYVYKYHTCVHICMCQILVRTDDHSPAPVILLSNTCHEPQP